MCKERKSCIHANTHKRNSSAVFMKPIRLVPLCKEFLGSNRRRIRSYSRVMMHTWNELLFLCVLVKGRNVSSTSAGSLPKFNIRKCYL